MSDCSHGLHASHDTPFHPLHCILPPYILTEIAAHGSSAQQAWAQQTLTITNTLFEQRQQISRGAVPIVEKGVGGKSRVVYDAKNGETLPGMKVRAEGEPVSADVAVNEAYDGAGATYDLYKDIYSRDSVDGNGLRLDSTVHFQNNYDNAFWNGQQMVYGDGDNALPPDQRLFNRFTIAIDVIGHELTHGVTQFTANLIYNAQPGALNESLSDVFGSLVKQRALGHSAAQADWLIGQGLLGSRVHGEALRSMKAPGTAYDDPVLGKDPQPASMRDYVHTASDNGGVHINSGIPNHAFYVTALELGGNAWDKAGRIWYVTLRDKLRAASDFQQAANLTLQAAGELFGANSLEQQAVRKGWAEVGITAQVGPAPVPTPTPSPTPTSGCLVTPLAYMLALKKRIFGR
jgi:Zn-dependent metalloprotease